MSPKKKDLTGQRFGRLTALYEADPWYTSGGNKKVMWHCVCDCGKEIDTASGSLLNGATRSCGCYNLECISERMSIIQKKYNEYDLSGDCGIGYTNKGVKFLFDKEDYDLIKDYCWYKHHNYIVAKVPHTDQKGTVTLHGLVMHGKFVDHINGDCLDNRKQNLRRPENDMVSFHTYNQMNKRVQRNNTSTVPGVKWHSRDNIWEAYISFNNKCMYLGRSTNFDEAVKLRKRAEEKYFGDWAYDKSRNREETNNEFVQD